MEDNIFNLENKLAVITGATEGIGKSIAKTFYNRGADIIIIGRNEDKLKRACQEISGNNQRKIDYLMCDLSKRDEVERTFQKLIKKYPNIDILVNNAGIYKEDSSTFKINGDKINFDCNIIDELINTNFMSYWIGGKYIEGAMKKNQKGCIINISSVNGISGKETCDIYDMTKSAINNLTLNQAKRLAKYNIRANAICPSSTITNMRNRAMELYPPKEGRQAFDKWEASTIPLKRLGKPEDIAYCALWLASDEGSYVTGQIIPVDGGYTLFRKSPSSMKD